MFSNKIEFHTNSYPRSISLQLKYNPDVMKWFTPLHLQRIRGLVGVKKWTG